MPFDLARAAARLRAKHGDPFAFRHAMLDLLFAVGCPVSEQAVALEHGDAICIRASGPAAPSLDGETLVVAIDLDPPHLSGVAAATGLPARWPRGLSSLGGPAVALSWMAVLRALHNSRRNRPWRALYVRGPSLGLGAWMRTLLSDVAPSTEMVQLVPSMPADEGENLAPCDLLRLDLVRSRNVWRFPACEHSYALSGALPEGEALPSLRTLFDGLGAESAWTLHDVHLYHPGPSHLAAVLRASTPLRDIPAGLVAHEVEGGQRLMFPINDALGSLQGLHARLSKHFGDALDRPVHMHVLPDGLRVFAVVPRLASLPSLPERAGSMTAHWEIEPLAISPTLAVLPFAVSDREVLGPVAPGPAANGAMIWRLPAMQTDDDLAGLYRALTSFLV